MANLTSNSTTHHSRILSIFEGGNPAHFDAAAPLKTFLIQAVIILSLSYLLHLILRIIHQPRVIAEIITGIILGPSILGRIPNFNVSIFPEKSLTFLNLIANLGLVIFMFLIGMETNVHNLKKHVCVSLGVAVLGMAIPFGLGVGVAKGLWNQFDSSNEFSFKIYALFIGVAMSITALPVLCRILTELDLFDTKVGIIVLSAGVFNDVIGWVLLAFTLTLINSSSPVTIIFTVLASFAWILFLLYPVRKCLHWLIRRSTAGFDSGPSESILILIIILVLISAYFTDIIGIHPIFGSFCVGLIIPHDINFAINIAKRMDAYTKLFFLPLYFASSGLKTNIGLLNKGISWAYTAIIIVIAMLGKIIGGFVAARVGKIEWRESLTVGVLMSCKGLVELIVLNIGLDAGIISSETFTIFVIMAFVSTFLTTPLVQRIFIRHNRQTSVVS